MNNRKREIHTRWDERRWIGGVNRMKEGNNTGEDTNGLLAYGSNEQDRCRGWDKSIRVCDVEMFLVDFQFRSIYSYYSYVHRRNTRRQNHLR